MTIVEYLLKKTRTSKYLRNRLRRMRNLKPKICLSSSVQTFRANTSYNVLTIPTATNYVLFLKRKYGLFKTNTYASRRIKQKIAFVSNFVRGRQFYRQVAYEDIFRRKPRTLSARRFNKLFFRAGRKVLMSYTPLKKYLTQRYITRKVFNMVKKPWVILFHQVQLNELLVRAKLFYSLTDSNNFINSFGINLNNQFTYDSTTAVQANDVFSLPLSKFFFRFWRRKKTIVLKHIARMKFYKYRSKLFLPKKRFIWIPSSHWIQYYTYIYTNQFSNIEFDLRTLTGVYLYFSDFNNISYLHDKVDLSFYMSRSYTWKYLT